ncbi:DUF418 domain-containing protein [Cnuibacter physcomitrellae]|uniref:DUF418 domain-containing protein n=1 Tax=Cnuibacter physcomitrellae TaxID=1619308 RepID=UPI00227B2C03|nr:DUF418 domain-containing protein [Cnuibacter physcomitrellae]
MRQGGPVSSSAPRRRRLLGLDVARGLALFGMVYAHVVPDNGVESIFDGRSAMLFATVSGVSLGLLSGGARRPPRSALPRLARRIAVRGGVLIALGLWFASLATPIATIFDVYGLLFLLAIPLLTLSRRHLALLVVVAALSGPALTGWFAETAAEPASLLHAMTSGEWGGHLGRWLTGHFPVATWSALVIAGLLLARCDLSARSTQAAAIVLGGGSSLLAYSVTASTAETSAAHSNSTWEVLGSGGLAIAIIGALCLALDLAEENGWTAVARLSSPLAAIGSMPLTLYCAHFAVIAVITAPLPLGSDPEQWQSVSLLIAMTALGVAFALLWRRWFRQGPLEWAMSALASPRSSLRARRMDA